MPTVSAPPSVSLAEFQEAAKVVSSFAYHTPLLTSRLLSERTGFDIRLKAEMFQKGGSYKLRGPLNKFRHLTPEQRERGVICSSAGNHAQGVALAAGVNKVKAVVVMASNATQSKVDATRAYGAEVVQHGLIWDEANEKAKQLMQERGLTYIHPFDDLQLITGQGTLGLEIFKDFPQVEVAVVPIGGGGLISGVSMALKASNPKIKIIGVESSDGPAMKKSVEAGRLITLDKIDCIIDGLRVKRVGENTFAVVQHYVDDIVALPDREIFDAMIWIMSHCKLVVEGAAAAPVAALLHGLIKAPAGTKVACVLSGGNVDLEQLKGLKWN
ncbi:MAG TPA: threonine/serine dehydratase [Candidatus Angelobacter sp.]|jgi:threonine dehydratase|nr:threonine/serine dehydratase [Candidatus Angelobacter sp.]